ncbi:MULTISPECIES: glutamate 5-kinase [Stappiaceae]|jgi:glutamate 5-kinase|uniref:Glutamate 5-kinase n=1 Tax=Roseibium aggregatum TaxID=187304 RepID=A0A0M6Y795_9HYPH|nr:MULTISPECIES: glutamate 5-kinase [Stappiaceae]MEC9403097.1 glutamate 5-kinase [Pseudomonadota bacterium]AMN54493.1 glutamate 5-kinase [Labrenzia sp. CP4]ERP88279.1 glutamate 5-kinase [Labrenzia sp. C1B10]ERP99776.1 glutamate 5-kinase [Labrenzia sp. C1B70]MBN8179954.1 glutamate 5-kinase [Roseibium aggregatum]
MSRSLRDFSRIVVKIGSALLVEQGELKRSWLNALIADVVKLSDAGAEVLLVSSGSIALGRGILGLPGGPLKLEESQAAAAAGQIALAQAYADALGAHGKKAGQILLTLGDTEERRRYLNARATIGTLLKLGAVPIINENDSVATSEIRYGDNDRLAARVATMASADCLVLLSDIDGLYTAPPQQNPDAVFLPEVPRITHEIESMAGSAGSELSRGGMKTKIDAGKIATAAGTSMVITSGKELNPLQRLDQGARGTWFPALSSPASARKAWIGGHLEPRGEIRLDAGAVKAMTSGKSLLPAGVTSVSGSFSRGDAVTLLNPEGRIIGRGLIAYDADEAQLIAGRNSREIEAIVGYPGRAEMIHRDDLVLELPALE